LEGSLKVFLRTLIKGEGKPIELLTMIIKAIELQAQPAYASVSHHLLF
jgi:hypothetical protein